MPYGVGHAHAVLTQETELPIEIRIRSRQHATVTGRQQLTRMKREAGDEPARMPNALPAIVPANLTPDGTRRILDDRNGSTLADLGDRCQIARHSELVHSQDCLRARADRGLDQRRIDVVRLSLDVHEDRHRTTVADCVRRRDERMTDRDDLAAARHSARSQREVQRGRATRHGAGVSRADGFREFPLERGDLGPLRDPTGEDHTPRRLGFALVEQWTRDRNRRRSRQTRTRSARHHFTSRDSPSSSVTDAERPSMLFAFSVEASRLGTGFTLRSGPYSGATRTPIARPSAAARSLRLVSMPVATLNTSSDTSDANANTFARAASST